jgi:uncharacterized protein (DUF433 family)
MNPALHPGPVEARALVEAEHDVHVLAPPARDAWLDSTRTKVVLSRMDGRGPCRRKVVSVTFTRITVRADQMGGVPCMRGLRIPVATVVGMIAEGMTDDEILQAYPDLEREDIREALRFAAEAVRERELPMVTD